MVQTQFDEPNNTGNIQKKNTLILDLQFATIQIALLL